MGPAQEGEGLSAYGPSSCTRPLLPEKGDQRNERGKETEGKEDGMTEDQRDAGRYGLVIEDGVVTDSALGWKSIRVPDGVRAIGRRALEGLWDLEEITLPDSLKEIGEEAFLNCRSLSAVTVPEGVTWIRRECFRGCGSLRSVRLSSRTKIIASGAFWDCRSLRTLELPKSLKTLGKKVFKGCESLTEIRVPKKVSIIENSTFSGCRSLKEAHLPSGITRIGESAFYGCSSLVRMEIPARTGWIQRFAFKECRSLSEVLLPDGLSHIDEEAFSGCTGISLLRLPEEVSLGTGAFRQVPCILCDSPYQSFGAALVALRGDPDEWGPYFRREAMKGFLYCQYKGIRDLDPFRESYLALIRKDIKKYAGQSLTDRDLFRFLIKEALLDRDQAEYLLEECVKRERVEDTAVLMEYLRTLPDGGEGLSPDIFSDPFSD